MTPPSGKWISAAFVSETTRKPWEFWSVPAAPEGGKLVLARAFGANMIHNHLYTRLQTGTHLCSFTHLCTRCWSGDVVCFLSWTENKNVCLFCRRHDSGRIMSSGAPKGPRLVTLERLNKQREDNDLEFKQKRVTSFQSFFARVLRTSENPLTHPVTPACSTQTVSEEPFVTILPIPLTPSFRGSSLPSARAATTLLRPHTPFLGSSSFPAVADEIMDDVPVMIPPISGHPRVSSRLEQHNSPVRPFSHEDRFTVDYPPVSKKRAGRIDEEIYFNHATHHPMRWKERPKDFFCVCDLNPCVPRMGFGEEAEREVSGTTPTVRKRGRYSDGTHKDDMSDRQKRRIGTQLFENFKGALAESFPVHEFTEDFWTLYETRLFRAKFEPLFHAHASQYDDEARWSHVEMYYNLIERKDFK